MRMKIAWLLTLIFCMTLALVVADLDLGPIIRTAQCRSTCLRHHMIDDNCEKINKTDTQINNCDECWNTCEILGHLEKEERHNTCMEHKYQNCLGCGTACTFFQLRGVEEEKYDPTKLPVPEEESGLIPISNYDIAVLIQRDLEGMWKEKSYNYTRMQLGTYLVMPPVSWIILVKNDVVKHYSWEKWRPKLQSLKTYGPLYQANITWQDWRTQLKNQREGIVSNHTIIEHWTIKEKQYKSSFVVTWQQEAGDGIMGNQITDSESAQISLPCGKYLIRVATDDGPGSYPIIIDTGICEIPKLSRNLSQFINDIQLQTALVAAIMFLMVFVCSITFLYLFKIFIQKIIKNGKKNKTKEGHFTEKKLMEEGNLIKKQKLMNQSTLRLWPNYSHPVNLWVKETDINVNSSVTAQDASNANVTQKS